MNLLKETILFFGEHCRKNGVEIVPFDTLDRLDQHTWIQRAKRTLRGQRVPSPQPVDNSTPLVRRKPN